MADKIITQQLTAFRTSLVVQCLRLHTSNAGSTGLIPGPGAKIPRAARHSHKKQTNERQLSHLKRTEDTVEEKTSFTVAPRKCKTPMNKPNKKYATWI